MNERDVIWALAEHHAILRWLSDRLISASTPTHRQHLFDEFSKALGGHLRSIDQAVLPAMRERQWKDVRSTLLVGHVELKHRLAELLTLRESETLFEQRLLEFVPRLADQLEREGAHLVPVLRNMLDPDARRLLGLQVESQFGMLFNQGFSSDTPEDARQLVEEARIVLSVLPVQ